MSFIFYYIIRHIFGNGTPVFLFLFCNIIATLYTYLARVPYSWVEKIVDITLLIIYIYPNPDPSRMKRNQPIGVKHLRLVHGVRQSSSRKKW